MSTLLRTVRPVPISSFSRRQFARGASALYNGQPVLHHEWVANGKVVNDRPSSTDDTVIFLHGLLGSGKNLRSPAKRLTQANPHLSALMIDLRGHGTTSASSTLKSLARAPHTLEACADDVVQTIRTLDLVGPESPVGVVGHSFGGRLALQYLHSLSHHPSDYPDEDDVHPPRSTWILDAVPGRAHSSVADVVDKISSVEMPIGSKKELVAELMENKGVDQDIALWMTTNLAKSPEGDGFVWSFDLDVARDVLDDFPNQDFVGLARDIGSKYVASADSATEGRRSKINIVMAGKTEAWTREVVEQLEGLRETGLPSEDPFLRMHLLPDAGHNVHVDDLDGLMNLMQGGFE